VLKKRVLDGKQLVDAIVRSAQDKLAEDIVILDLRQVPGAADWFIICQGDNTVQNRAIADGIVDELSGLGTHPWHQEGESDGRWILIDYSDVVVHVMLPDLREFYSIETLWNEAKRVRSGQ